ncbi:MAG: hypothetical protein JWP08_1116 [Bryobacterales bacterium]|nr:hypothetical protein [Bryobacterales bacterium]
MLASEEAPVLAVLLSGDSVSPRLRTKAWLWVNLLSIDAPLVAVAWQVWFAQCFDVPLAPLSVLALALTVWMIYATDRLLDVRRSEVPLLTERHRFHKKHAQSISIAVVFCLGALVPITILLRPVLLRDGLMLSAVVALYFALVHVLPTALSRWCPKEMAVGIVFALGAGLAPWSRMQRPEPLIVPLVLFAFLCWLNCAAIEVWEGAPSGQRSSGSPHPLTLWLTRWIRLLSVLTATAGALLLSLSKEHVVFAPVVLSALAFTWLDGERERLPADALRVLADVPLLSPLVLLLLGMR